MTEWDPKDEMGLIAYAKFKLGLWVDVETIPEWVKSAERSYYDQFVDERGHRPYDVQKEFVGDSLVYQVTFRAIAQGQIRPEYRVKIKDR